MSEGRAPAPVEKAPLPATPERPDERAERLVVDAEFHVVSFPGRLWRAFRRHWWAIGPYLTYCAVLWGLAALVGWLIDGRR